jgi:hypothetical protein
MVGEGGRRQRRRRGRGGKKEAKAEREVLQRGGESGLVAVVGG